MKLYIYGCLYGTIYKTSRSREIEITDPCAEPWFNNTSVPAHEEYFFYSKNTLVWITALFQYQNDQQQPMSIAEFFLPEISIIRAIPPNSYFVCCNYNTTVQVSPQHSKLYMGQKYSGKKNTMTYHLKNYLILRTGAAEGIKGLSSSANDTMKKLSDLFLQGVQAVPQRSPEMHDF